LYHCFIEISLFTPEHAPPSVYLTRLAVTLTFDLLTSKLFSSFLSPSATKV